MAIEPVFMVIPNQPMISSNDLILSPYDMQVIDDEQVHYVYNMVVFLDQIH
jgi:hypothetical protein